MPRNSLVKYNQKINDFKEEMNMYIVTHTDAKGELEEREYKTFCYAIGQLLFYIYHPTPGSYKITFTRIRGENEKEQD